MKFIKLSLLFVLLLACNYVSVSQVVTSGSQPYPNADSLNVNSMDSAYVNVNRGELNIIASPLLDSILDKKNVYDSYNSGYDGYRVQIFSTSGSNSKSLAYSVAESFDSLNLNIPAFVTFRAPYYRVRVGNFHDKIDADKLLSRLIVKYKASFVVKEFISSFDTPYKSAATLEKERLLDSISSVEQNMLHLNDSIVPDSSLYVPEN